MTEEEKIEEIKLLVNLEDKYRKVFAPELDEEMNGIHINDDRIFPRFWFSIDNNKFKIGLLEKSLSESKPLFELEEVNNVERNITIANLSDSIEREIGNRLK